MSQVRSAPRVPGLDLGKGALLLDFPTVLRLACALGATALAGALVWSAANAQTLDAPNAIDRRASYCVGVIDDHIDALDGIQPFFASAPGAAVAFAKERRSVQASKARLLAYLVPRARRFDPAVITTEVKSGRADAEQDRLERQRTKCRSIDPRALRKCVDAAMQKSPAAQRLAQCDDLSFLPS